MKILFVAINAKYIHSNPAVYSLRAYAENGSAVSNQPGPNQPESNQQGCSDTTSADTIEIAEYTINQPMQKIMADICGRKPDLLFCSCYIWNIRYVEELVRDLVKVMSGVDIWLGGPEVSFDAKDALRRLPGIRGIIRGEGEESFRRIREHYDRIRKTDGVCAAADNDTCTAGGADFAAIRGVTFRMADGSIVSTPDAAPLHLDALPFFYGSCDAVGFCDTDASGDSRDPVGSGGPRDVSAPLQDFANRIVYYESSRGCPFRCSYCLSSLEKTLRFKSLDKVKRELKFFLERNVPQVKFVDRTFNCDHQRAVEIWNFLREHDNGVTNFHFEVGGDLLTDEEIDILADMRPGQIQLEIGVQTTNRDTLREIRRPMDFGKLADAVQALRAKNNVHLHLDLIAGLPYEDLASFEKSFNDVFCLRPHQLQLGFLKVLKGSPMESGRDAYGLKHTEAPPYEVLETKWLSYEELTRLKRIEEMVEVYYNSGRFCNVLDVLEPYFDGAFQMFDRLAEWYRHHGLEMLNMARDSRYEHLLAFGRSIFPEQASRTALSKQADEGRPTNAPMDTLRDALMDALLLDYYSGENAKNRPAFFRADSVDKAFSKAFYSREAREHRYLTGRQCAETDDPRLLRKLSHLELLDSRLLLFDYTRRDAVSGRYAVTEVPAAF